MSTAPQELREEIKRLIVETLKIPDVEPAEIGDDDLLFGNDRFQLDSIDALELFMALQKHYGVRVDGPNTARAVLESVSKIADFVQANRSTATAASS